MKIEQLKVSNFRCFGPDPVMIAFEPGVTALVGNNGSGKTAVLAALGRLFGVTPSQRTVGKSDFHVPKDADGVAPGTLLVIDCVLGWKSRSTGKGQTAISYIAVCPLQRRTCPPMSFMEEITKLRLQPKNGGFLNG